MVNRSTACAMVALALLSSTASASVIDTVALTSPDATSFTDSTGTLFSLTATQPTGSGVFLPFMRMAHTGNSQGYNSSLNNGSDATMDLINLPGNSTPQMPLNNVVVDGKVYLTMDYNEQGSSGKSPITLEELLLVVSTDPDKTGPVGPKKDEPWSIQNLPLSAGDQVVYQMSSNVNANNSLFAILLNADKNAANGNGGSGTADLNVAVNLASVANLANLLDGNHYLYVYSRFSGVGAGYEEWNSYNSESNPNGGGGQVPEPATMGLLAVGAAGLLRRRRRA
jgi:hypothetical protein